MLKMKRKGNKIKGLNIATWTIVIATTSAKSHDRQENWGRLTSFASAWGILKIEDSFAYYLPSWIHANNQSSGWHSIFRKKYLMFSISREIRILAKALIQLFSSISSIASIWNKNFRLCFAKNELASWRWLLGSQHLKDVASSFCG